MKILLYLYIIISVYLLFKYSKSKTLYIFSPYIIIYLSFVFNDIVPFLLLYPDIPENLQYTTFTATIINLLFLYVFRKQLLIQTNLDIPSFSIKLNKKRKIIICCFALLLFCAGIMSGVLTNLLKGNDIEDLRRTSEIGLGVIRDIPMLGIQIVMLVLFLQKSWNFYRSIAFYSFCLGAFLFLTTGNKGGVLVGTTLFFLFFHFKKRGFKWYDYIAYYLAIPLAAGTLQGIRGGDLTLIASHIAVFFSYPIVLYQANSIPIMNSVGTESIFWGEEYYVGLVKIIPRFLWPDKPLAFDYKLKELVGYDFDGGGIYTTLSNDLYINFGYSYFIFYILWLLFVHYIYGIIIDSKRNYYSRIIALFIILMGGIASTIGSCEILLLFLFFMMLYYSRIKTL